MKYKPEVAEWKIFFIDGVDKETKESLIQAYIRFAEYGDTKRLEIPKKTVKLGGRV